MIAQCKPVYTRSDRLRLCPQTLGLPCGSHSRDEKAMRQLRASAPTTTVPLLCYQPDRIYAPVQRERLPAMPSSALPNQEFQLYTKAQIPPECVERPREAVYPDLRCSCSPPQTCCRLRCRLRRRAVPTHRINTKDINCRLYSMSVSRVHADHHTTDVSPSLPSYRSKTHPTVR